MYCGIGIIHGKSPTHKFNKKITTDSEVVAVSEYVPYTIHIINIFLGQGYALHKNILYQDNEIATKMEKNGRKACTGNSRHISISYFFFNDCVDKEMV